MSSRRRFVRIATIAIGVPFLAVIAFLALTPRRIEERIPNVLDLVLATAHRLGWTSLDFMTLEILANVLVFIPVGIIAYVFAPRRLRWLALLAGPAASVSIELVQLLALPNRVPSIADVAENVLGATIGVALCALASRVLNSPASASPTLETS
ncbi:glycopeptide antibiotics resistance protein [Microbacterium natoriense]|uniref:Glycopeptide antibiotics resistance protein n=1 Tax=Microbacterium natoriense TaxID=284570 RepID=A0AAW8F2D6_9MICO|nr:VanZ family protein [Microbacterium natoriense]MDQ0649204.1 glycopeptide antibiotics resistance protein [Microbacterium natoriense]